MTDRPDQQRLVRGSAGGVRSGYPREPERRCSFSFTKSMADIYTRLRHAGLDPGFVRERLLPDWWTDHLADVPSNRQLAEATLSRMLGIPLARFSDPTASLELRPAHAVRLKHVRNRDRADLTPSVLIAERAAASVVRSLRDLPPFGGALAAAEVRSRILARHHVVNLATLVEFAWDQGVVVVHLAELPPGRKLHGVATFEADVPVTILAQGSDAPPRLAFDLAHELGHILLGHVTRDSAPLADEDLTTTDEDPVETAANDFASEVLTGCAVIPLEPELGLTGDKLASRCRRAEAAHRIDAGVLALAYGFHAGRMPVAQVALKALRRSSGARAIIAGELQRRLAPELPDAAARWIDLATST